MTQQARVLIKKIDDLATGFIHSQVLFTADQAGAFTVLKTPMTAQAFAERLGWMLRSAQMLLDGLVALELVEVHDGQYQNTAIATACLTPDGAACQVNIIRHRYNAWRSWSRLGECLARGKGVAEERAERPPEELRNFILGMRDISRFSAREMLGVLDLSKYRHMLDLGGGPATYSIIFAEANPALRATVFDIPPVIEIAQAEVAEAGLMDRFGFLPGDMTQHDFSGGYDLILISNIIHSFDAETNCAIFRKCYDALEPGGRLIIKDFIVEDDRSGPAFGLMFALNMFLHTEAGNTYSFKEVAAWTAAAGFPDGEMLSLTPQTRLWMVDKA